MSERPAIRRGRQALAAAEQQLEQMRVRKVALEGQVEALTGQYRLVQATSTRGQVKVDAGKLAQAERLVAEIRQQLNVAEHVLAREAKFTQPIPVDTIDPQDLVARVARHFEGAPANELAATPAPAKAGDDNNAVTTTAPAASSHSGR
jgi:hypothetical protein